MNRTKLIYSAYMMLSIFVLSFISGIVNAQIMSQVINPNLPQQDPYCIDGGAFLSGVADDDKLSFCPRAPLGGAAEVPDGVVDWVLVELRAVDNNNTAGSTDVTAAAGNTVISRKPAYLLANGRIVDSDLYVGLESSKQVPTPCAALTEHENCPDLVFDQGDVASQVTGKDLYLVIHHRNHVSIISSAHLTDDSGVYSYDFSLSADQARGGSSALKLKANTYAMYGGDADGSNTVTPADYSNGVALDVGKLEYQNSDVDFGGSVTPADYSDIIAANVGVAAQVPN